MTISLDEVLFIHSLTLKKTGGLPGVKDMGLLESAVASTFNSFDGVDNYPSVLDKATHLAFSIIKNHAFNDGNKRTGVGCMLLFLTLSGVNLKFEKDELVDLGLGIAKGDYGFDEIKQWILEHVTSKTNDEN